jgi:FkbM family methyltransferase
MLKSVANAILRRRQLSIVADWELDACVASRHFRRILDRHKIDCVLDVGANRGQFRAFARSAGWSGKLISFEPVKAYYDAIQGEAYNYALGNTDGVEYITTFQDSPAFASICQPDIAAMDKVMPRKIRPEKREAITVRRLSSVLDEIAPDARRIFLKTDTQGYDLEVFRGAATVLDRIAALWVEISFLPIYKDAPSYADALGEFKSAGFHVSGMFPVVHDSSLRAVEFDCALVRDLTPGPAAVGMREPAAP